MVTRNLEDLIKQSSNSENSYILPIYVTNNNQMTLESVGEEYNKAT